MDTLAPLNAVAYPEGAARSLNEGAVRHIPVSQRISSTKFRLIWVFHHT